MRWATPTFDHLAREGVTLTRHYGASVCAPARACLMTGRSELHTGFWRGTATLRLNETTLAQELRSAGCVDGTPHTQPTRVVALLVVLVKLSRRTSGFHLRRGARTTR